MEITTRIELDIECAGFKCANPECKKTHKGKDFLEVPECHPDSGFILHYFKGGLLQLECDECGAICMKVRIE